MIVAFALGRSDEATPLNALTELIIGASIEVRRVLGPGLLESADEACPYYELLTRGMKVERQKVLPLVYAGVTLEYAYRLDMAVDDAVGAEVKSVAELDRVHDAHMLPFLKLSKKCVGLMFDFHVKTLTQGGVRRRVNGFTE